MEFLKALFIIIYFSILFILAIYGCHRYYLVYLYYRHKKNTPHPKHEFKDLPKVTVQLPIFNEMYVVQRLVTAVSNLNYPKDLLEIQILDDSTDETQKIAESLAQEFKQKGFSIEYLHRTNRVGFKAGALDAGLKKTSSDFIYIFDADFIPNPDIIQKTIHFFTEPEIGMVQVRWGHINRDYSILTQIQSIFLDGHFMIEHTARNRSGRFFNFNGTAGVWRKQAIMASGGWHCDTLTEDLDLSYRAQLQGWKFVYLPDVVSPAELPVEMNSFKSQQHRWVKGSIQTGKKLLPKIWKSPVPLRVKIEATFHLTNNLSYLLMIVLIFLLLPAMFIRFDDAWGHLILIDVPLFIASFFSISAFYICSQKEIYGNWLKRLKYIPLISSVGIGLSINNAKAVLEALLDHETPFQRTPKYGVHTAQDSWKSKKYRGQRTKLAWVELGLGLYFGGLTFFALATQRFVMAPFLVIFHIGYLYTWFLSLFQDRKKKPVKLFAPQPAEA
jgi:cellulose synthase/poly-beta-1,6-N-acetylglucosamine synthase-like glycosyltransferase